MGSCWMGNRSPGWHKLANECGNGTLDMESIFMGKGNMGRGKNDGGRKEEIPRSLVSNMFRLGFMQSGEVAKK